MDDFSDSSDCSDSEIREYEKQALEDLKEERYCLKNSDGTLRCPFCIGKKKQDYKYVDLLQHANGVGQGKRGDEPTGKHRALAEFMKEHLGHMNGPAKPRIIHLEQEAPQRPDSEDLVWPWMGIVVNIARTKESGMYVAAGNSELKEHFADFGPIQVRTLWNYEGHQGKAILEFRKDMAGYEDALSFERSFSDKGLGKKEWNETQHGNDLYGWIARREDFESRELIGKYLREKGNLKTVAQISEENLRKKDQLVENLSSILVEKDRKIENWQGQVKLLKDQVELTEVARRRAEYEKLQLEEKLRREIEKVEQEIQQLHYEHCQEKLQIRKDMEKAMIEIEKRRKELEKLEVHTDAEKRKFEEEKKKNQDRKERLQKVNNLQKKQEQDQLKLIEKHKIENEDLISELHRYKKRIETEKHLEGNTGEEQINNVQNLETKLRDLQEDMEGLQQMNQQLMNKERVVNDELQEARKVATDLKLNETDEKLSKLRQELGNDVCQTVVKALEELNEYNASGRYPVPVPWNYKQNRKALIKEIIMYMYDCITAPKRKKRRRQL